MIHNGLQNEQKKISKGIDPLKITQHYLDQVESSTESNTIRLHKNPIVTMLVSMKIPTKRIHMPIS